ncbi:DUF4388 domain-containing protein [Deinococcus sp. QL22]|uniref:DUF4388 domain-containing protein n=1 Tax=Deinococcus sp. QL22 TaxID=2939437 RepID=UPI002016E440|nr:DUF4388 domain-containing protein [Deinococcus sp. QL22]UQN05325.1 DUF4388 domain-containing protein [Deinococcus sp. QL22]
MLDALYAHVPDSLDWQIHSFDTPEHVTKLDAREPPQLVVMVCARPDYVLDASLISLLDYAKQHWPHTFFIVVSGQALPQLETLSERFGTIPVADITNSAALSRNILREMDQHSTGSLQGVSLPSFLQMMEWDQKSIAVRVAGKERWGRLDLRQGRLVDAYASPSGSVGEAAALEIMGWEGLEISLERSYHNHAAVIQRPLTTLLMEAMQQRDEAFHAQPGIQVQDLLMDDDLEEALMFRRPKHSTAQLNKPRAAPSPPTTDAPPPVASKSLETTPAPLAHPWAHQETLMTNVKDTLNSALASIDGIMAAALVDYSSGMALGTVGSGFDLELAAAGNSEVVKAKMKTMQMLGIQGEIEDILITLQSQYHVIYIVPNQTLFLYLVLSKEKSNLAMARFKIKALAKDISIN